ncbi:hypothetical protein BDY24DRAFT_437752 [Mrakia frigida]|uniref:uncharacterized protein n=1 Tax=Mrakia frigida TaxID=29902 RepID=UPI003FCC0406
MDLVLARIGQLEELAVLQEVENEAQRSSVSHLSSVVARLSSENQSLKRSGEDQDRVIAELSRTAVPEGFWVWESEKEGREGGRWLWSREKYKSPPPVLPRPAGPRASLESLPIEILSLVFDSFNCRELAAVMETSFQMLRLTTSQMYGSVTMRSKEAASLVSSRVMEPDFKSSRISSLLLPQTLILSGKSNGFLSTLHQALTSAVSTSPLASLEIPLLVLDGSDILRVIPHWSPVLRYFNPREIHLQGGGDDDLEACLLPPTTISHVPSSIASFTSGWNRLRSVVCSGPGSVPLLQLFPKSTGHSSSFAFTRAMEGAEMRPVEFRLYRLPRKPDTMKKIGERDLPTSLAEALRKTPRKGVEFWLVVERRKRREQD